MKTLQYSYEVIGNLVAIDDSETGQTVFMSMDQVLAEIRDEIGSLVGKHIVWRGYDGIWDLLLPTAQLDWMTTGIYPLGATTLPEAIAQIQQLVMSGKLAEG